MERLKTLFTGIVLVVIFLILIYYLGNFNVKARTRPQPSSSSSLNEKPSFLSSNEKPPPSSSSSSNEKPPPSSSSSSNEKPSSLSSNEKPPPSSSSSSNEKPSSLSSNEKPPPSSSNEKPSSLSSNEKPPPSSSSSANEKPPPSSLSERPPLSSSSERSPPSSSSERPPLSSSDTNYEPMALSLSYWEQTANAQSNLLDLQCWASSVNISKVVMPAIEAYGKSVFHFGLKKESLTFEDLFDLENYNKVSHHRGYSILVSQQYFLVHASRNIVYVKILYSDGFQSCQSMETLKKQAWYKLLSSKGFFVSRIVCIDFKKAPSHIISTGDFQQKILEDSENVTLLFESWEGIRKNYRVALKGTGCTGLIGSIGRLKAVKRYKYAPANSSRLILPSRKIQSYVDKFLKLHIPDGKYIAIMLRTEKLFRYSKYKDIVSQPLDDNPCASDLVSDWNEMVTNTSITHALFSSDIGGHGSMGWNNPKALNFSQFIEGHVKPHLNLEEVNSILEKITGSKDSVQIAMIQQQLVAQATCILIVGGGSFQGQTFNMYAHNHKGKECYTARDMMCKVAAHHFGV